MMTTDGVGLYVHIPFCAAKCNYCDFTSFPCVTKDKRSSYIDSLINEIHSYGADPRIKVETLFFGGGTPSYLDCDEIVRIYDAIRECFDLSSLREFTTEINPGTVSDEKMRLFAKIGVNRISIGLQTIHENERIKLGRIHNLHDFQETVKLARGYCINNINADLMFGIPDQTVDSFKTTLEFVSSLNIPHVSVYGLMIEENTVFGRERDRLLLPDEDTEAEMYYLAADILAAGGYEHYEISNYAKPGYESMHNLKYWTCEEYIGVGLSASSYYGNKRYSNTSNIDDYVAGKYFLDDSFELIDRKAALDEFVMLSLRLRSGLSLLELRSRFNIDLLQLAGDVIQKYSELNIIKIQDGRIFLTNKGFYVSNTVISDILTYFDEIK